MNWERIEGNWERFRGTAKQRWGKLTEDQLDGVAGRRQQLAGSLEQAYGITGEAAERQVAQWQADQRDEHSAEDLASEIAKAIESAKAGKSAQ